MITDDNSNHHRETSNWHINVNENEPLLFTEESNIQEEKKHDKQLVTKTPTNDIIESFRLERSSTHCHIPDAKFDYGARNRLIIVLLLCIVFMIIEIVGGVLSNSTAVITDAAHMAIDVASFVISLTAMYLGTKRPTPRLSFGYSRAEVLGALMSVLTIWLATGVLVYMAIQRCINQNFTVNSLEMIITASCGVLFNIVMFFVLHANDCNSIPHHGHSHGTMEHGHSHSHQNHKQINEDTSPAIATDIMVDVEPSSIMQKPEKKRLRRPTHDINVRAAIIHVIGDFAQSVGVLVAAIVIKFKVRGFLYRTVPHHIDYLDVIEDLLRIPGVRNAHSLHIWSLSMKKAALSVHIVVDSDHNHLALLHQAQDILRREHSIDRTTIQIEEYDDIMAFCENCKRPGV
ncbi:unnamed protein product [Didymodactylos carnosus]|uniref:Zinc transporter 2-like n=2 Tax=Didymodactylos carnosus TaxID=1234261 RepID=A0A814SQA1_9BILA|nr:unnamed protein product [Didymodactylos carnosus]CAF1149009.1 unnamed protein product [Didymodactylos carnosus]CAF3588128.1 unnamed protein product [Didymodactylos carnosus]CAF3912557.1 unnamed protein product [Didymodactylos carnosus]